MTKTIIYSNCSVILFLSQDNWGRTMSRVASRWNRLSDEEKDVYRSKARRHNAARLLRRSSPTYSATTRRQY